MNTLVCFFSCASERPMAADEKVLSASMGFTDLNLALVVQNHALITRIQVSVVTLTVHTPCNMCFRHNTVQTWILTWPLDSCTHALTSVHCAHSRECECNLSFWEALVFCALECDWICVCIDCSLCRASGRLSATPAYCWWRTRKVPRNGRSVFSSFQVVF